MQLLSAEKETWLAGDVRRLTLKIAAPSVAAMVASAFCSLLETLILGRSDAQLSAAIGACFALTALEQTVGFTLGMGAGSSVSRCLGCGSSGRALRSASVGFSPRWRFPAFFRSSGCSLPRPRFRCSAHPSAARPAQSTRTMSACARRRSAVR